MINRKLDKLLGTVTVKTIPLETDMAMAGIRCLKVQAGCIGVTLVALRAVVHSWLHCVRQA